MAAYYIEYKMDRVSSVKGCDVLARNKAEAYDKAVYEKIKQTEGSLPYSAWVHSVTYNNGNYRTFNTLEGKPY